jgi:hypothetical protein
VTQSKIVMMAFGVKDHSKIFFFGEGNNLEIKTIFFVISNKINHKSIQVINSIIDMFKIGVYFKISNCKILIHFGQSFQFKDLYIFKKKTF